MLGGMVPLWSLVPFWLRNAAVRGADRLWHLFIRASDKDAQRQVTSKYKEVYKQTPNFSKGRVIIPKAVVLHHTSGGYKGSVEWCLNPDSMVSYHCIIKRDGERTVLASDNERTWHAGKSYWRNKPDLNSWSLGVSFEGDTYKEPLSKEMIESAIEYLVPRMKKLSLTIKDVTDHRTVSPNRKNDLNPTEYNKFMGELKKHV
jgi:N-acetyl-anhydromuramyl-L-alanine amidase AmpD